MKGHELVAAAIGAALESTPAAPVQLGRFRHAWITEGLHASVFGQGHSPRTLKPVPVLWGDGTTSPAFPVRCLPPPLISEERACTMRFGLISGRHPALDEFVELYVLRNREIGLSDESLAEQEALAFEASSRLLEDCANSGGGLLEMYQAGLEPAVVGFYRAVVHKLLSRRGGKVQVQPCIFKPAKQRLGQVFGGLAEIRRAVELHSEFLDVIPILDAGQHEFALRWRPERPMTDEEHDILAEVFGRHGSLATTLFRKSQYQRPSIWG